MIIKSHLHFIEKIIEEDIKNGFSSEKIRFRFPPEPNGYLHIGHVKAIYLNFELGKKYNAPVNLRFDDTNPIGEKIKFTDSIKKDIKFLGFKWDQEYYASDYFQQLYEWAIELVKNNKAYVDNLPKAIIQFQRKNPFESGINSNYRNRSINENLYLFEKMKKGFFEEGTCVLRAKIDMSSSNMNMRDPIMYRILKKKHHRTKHKWCIYPTYDWTHGLCDYIEQISHSLCTLEFENRRPLYNWYLDQVCEKNKIRPKQIEFSRLNLSYSITSKRKIQYLINKKIIQSWEDPRIFTISGLRHRGYTSIGIKNFIQEIGISKRNNIIDTSLLEFKIREHLNKISPRVMVVLDPIKLIIDNYSSNKIEWVDSENNPENPRFGHRKIPFSKYLYIEKNDFLEKKRKEFFRLSIGCEVRLKNAYIIQANSIIKDSNGKIIEVHCTYDPKSKSGKKENIKKKGKIKSTLHWVSIKHSIPINIYIYNSLFLIEKTDKNLNQYINPKSIEKIIGYAEPSIHKAKKGDHFQFQRIGYFYVGTTKKYNKKLIFHKTVSMKDQWKKINDKNKKIEL
ncbi:glutamine--tRNA ligase [Blattabacterium sp. (Cryptocercus kyebangensis)]|uniref:glutamine--tRNA ligase/YqeY domain fusion protein n=1 Tax=Blattabacterium sp. (Cryptocercus kyebangensis) TaxID=298656 RepID=UPI000D7BD151|nr:glutamine--tRNA ligase/YqeY domain fusion protein [Blattabacterium sp. (Cryptocercus kyebangensis)]AWU43628.1 glutamine--tRNA ligase [Blattabacterium sp. (Cryptocercus kyebangensis)]